MLSITESWLLPPNTTCLLTLQREWKQPQTNSLQVLHGIIAETSAKDVSHHGPISLPQRESFIPNPFAKTSLHLSTICHAVPTHMFRLVVQMDVPTNLRIGMVHKKLDWEHRPKGKFMVYHDKLCVIWEMVGRLCRTNHFSNVKKRSQYKDLQCFLLLSW